MVLLGFCKILILNTVEPRVSGQARIGAPLVSGQKFGNLLFSFKNNPVYRGAIHLTRHSTEDFFHLSNMLYTFEQLSILCNGR